MRITKDLQEKIFANLLASHELQKRAIIATNYRQAHLIELQYEIARKEIGADSQAALRAHYQKMRDAMPDNSFFATNLYQSTLTLSTNEDGEPSGVSHDSATVYLAGQRREFYYDGDVDREPELTVADITPRGYEFANVAGIFEEREEIKPGYGRFYPFYKLRSTPQLAADHWFVKAIEENDAERRAIRGEFTTLKSTVFASLNKFTTVKKLIEAWPEIAPFVPGAAKPAGTGLALSREDLNAICGLPK